MKKYFQLKLTNIVKHIELNTKHLVDAANDLNIKALQVHTEQLNKFTSEWADFTQDAVVYCTVPEIIELWNAGLLRKYSAESAFKYTRTVTIEERELLVKANYGFREAKV